MPFSQEIVILDSKRIVAASIRTSFDNESSADNAQISSFIGSYFQNNMSSKINHRIRPGIMIDGFMAYDPDYQHGCNYDGPYTYFVGEEVSSFDGVDSSFKCIEVPAGRYVKFTTVRGPMPQIIINAWHKIWQMTEEELGGKRSYLVDFEVFDERSMDPLNAVVEIYLGID